jgi:hypothetical protein
MRVRRNRRVCIVKGTGETAPPASSHWPTPALDDSARRRAVRGGRVRVEAGPVRARGVGRADRCQVCVSSDVKERARVARPDAHRSEKAAAIVGRPAEVEPSYTGHGRGASHVPTGRLVARATQYLAQAHRSVETVCRLANHRLVITVLRKNNLVITHSYRNIISKPYCRTVGGLVLRYARHETTRISANHYCRTDRRRKACRR